MERVTNKNKKPLWRKTTPGTLILRGLSTPRIKPKQEVYATKEELGRWCETDFELVKGGKGKYKIDKKEEESVEDESAEFENSGEEFTVKHAGRGRYNVLSSTGKIMNETNLGKKEAKALKSVLEHVKED